MELRPEKYWEKAGVVGYGQAMFSATAVEEHVNRRLWHIALAIGEQLGLDRQSSVLDLGCGDGAFANAVLGRYFRTVDGIDLSDAGIRRAAANACGEHMCFAARDITQLDYGNLPRYDGVFLMGILHHVKQAAPSIIRSLRGLTPRVIVLEPNGDNLVRKALEFTPAYRAAGEDSFRTRTLRDLFETAGFKTVVWQRLNLFPNFTPHWMFRLLRPLEPIFEITPGLRAACTVNMYGFVGV